MSLIRCIHLILLLGIPAFLAAQDSSALSSLQTFPAKYYDKVSTKISGLEGSLDRKTEQYLQKLARQEEKIYKKLWRKDSAKAKELFGDIPSRYAQLKQDAKEKAGKLASFAKVYNGKLDSLSTAFQFLGKTGLVNPALQDKLKTGLGSISQFQNKLDQSEQIKQYLRERKKLLTAQLEKLGMLKELKKFNKELFYYKQQLEEYKSLLHDQRKMEEKLFGLLAKIPAFKDFFADNSQLGQLFRLPGASDPLGGQGGSLGLQTRASVMQDLQTRFGSGPQVQQAMQQNLQSAQSQLNQLKDKVNQYLPQGGSSESELPDFKPNNQRTKGFWKRLELGSNFQNQKRSSLLPVTSDLGLSLGYRLNDRSVIGIGASYKLGWGESIQKIRLSHQGAGLRTFIDWKIKGSFYLSGGYELNYQPALRNVTLTNPSGTGVEARVRSESGLLGISKIVSLNSKLFKKTRVQLLWDFLSAKQIPRAQAIVFRIGYTF